MRRKIPKKISTKDLAWTCVALQVLYPLLAWPIVGFLAPGDDGILAALFAANSGTAFFAWLAFDLRELRGHTTRALRLSVLSIGVICGFLSAVHWMADEVENLWLRMGISSPIIIILVVLLWFVYKAIVEGTDRNEG